MIMATAAAVAASALTQQQLPAEDAILAICNNQAPLIPGVPVGSALDVFFEDGSQLGMNLVWILVLAGIMWSFIAKYAKAIYVLRQRRRTWIKVRARKAKQCRLSGEYLDGYMHDYALPSFWDIPGQLDFMENWTDARTAESSMTTVLGDGARSWATIAQQDSIKHERY